MDENAISRSQADAYGRVMTALRDVDADLRDDEAQTIREACDALVLGDGDAQHLVVRARGVCRDLVDSGRWSEDEAGNLRADVLACAGRDARGRRSGLAAA